MTSMGAETFSSTLNLKESFLGAATRKNQTKLRNSEKTWKKKITAMKVKMRYQILNSLKPFEFEPKTSRASTVQKQSLADVLQNRCQT